MGTNDDENYGYQFFYKNRKIGESNFLDAVEVSEMEDGKGNSDNIFIFCVKCGVQMDFKPGESDCLDGKWICPDCKRSVREATPYVQLDRENELYLDSLNDDYDDDFDLYRKCNPFDD